MYSGVRKCNTLAVLSCGDQRGFYSEVKSNKCRVTIRNN